MRILYSSNELEMVKQLAPDWYRIITSNNDTTFPLEVFKIIALRCFIENKTGTQVDNLRRVLTALTNCSAYRNTPEYESLFL